MTTRNAAICLDTLAATALCGSKEETRYYLRGVCLEIEARATVYVATDGHRLFARRLELSDGAPDNSLLGKFIIPLESCSAFKRTKRAPSGAVLSAGENDLDLTLIYGADRRGFGAIDGSFPDWRRCVVRTPNDTANNDSFGFDPASLVTFDKIGDALGLGKPRLRRDGGNPATLFFDDLDSVVAVIMPKRYSREIADFALPAWL